MVKNNLLMTKITAGALFVVLASFAMAYSSPASAAVKKHGILSDIGGAVAGAGRAVGRAAGSVGRTVGRAAGGVGGVVLGRSGGRSGRPVVVTQRPIRRPPPAAAPTVRDHRQPVGSVTVRDHRTPTVVRDHRR